MTTKKTEKNFIHSRNGVVYWHKYDWQQLIVISHFPEEKKGVNFMALATPADKVASLWFIDYDLHTFDLDTNEDLEFLIPCTSISVKHRGRMSYDDLKKILAERHPEYAHYLTTNRK